MTDETRNSKLETGNSKLDPGNPDSGIRISDSADGLAVIVEDPAAVDRGGALAPEAKPLLVAKPKSSITLPLLLEVGCEEIPARFLRDAEKGLGEWVEEALLQAGLIGPGTATKKTQTPVIRTYSTPRRLVVHVPALMVQQPDKSEEVLGPPVKVALDAEGKYTRAAESFAQKNSSRVEDLARTTTPKGEYLSLTKLTPGRPAREILAEVLPGAILGLTFPKSMYWTEKSAPRFVRPIRWIVAVLGEGKEAATVEFEILRVKSGNFTFGHRTKSGKPLFVKGFRDYAKKLSQDLVEVDYKQRLARVVEDSLAMGGSVGRIVQDEWLMDWIANSTEWPHPMLGSFDPRFLHLPREILITVMRDHQRYFAVEEAGAVGAAASDQPKLAPHFVAVLNMPSDEQGLIRQGHQRVLTARFRDAEFFWNADQKIPLRERVPLLDKVTYQARLGSYGAKIQRMKAIAKNICAKLETTGSIQADQTPHVLRAVELCKCDLTAQMVQEFTELQGIVGGLYAQVQGEPEEVSAAIYDHYLPAGAEGNSPRTLVGAVVSLADKVDSVVAGFAAGYEPTGSSDPFALRRQANGIVKVLLENLLALSIKEMANHASGVLDIEWRKPREVVIARVLDFFAERLRFYFDSVRHFRYDTVRAVVAAGADQPADALARAEAMEALRGGEDFEALSAAAKRIRNILTKSATAADWQAGEVESELLAAPQEIDLNADYGRVALEVEQRQAVRDYRGALEVISTLRPAVDRFFDAVMVMAEDREVRQNRLRLLKKLDALFSGIAHFADIAEGQ